MSGKLRVLSLFAGIGGFDLGLERTGGFETAAFCEIDPFCRRVLAKHWPEVPCYHDIRKLTGKQLSADGIRVDAICGGFPCQDLSRAAHAGSGLAGARSGLWREYARLVRELEPRIVIVENVSALCGDGLGEVVADLAEIGFRVEWDCIPASAVGAPHPRDRVWIMAYTAEVFGQEQLRDEPRRILSPDGLLSFVYDQGRSHGFASWRAAEPRVARGAHGVPNRVDRLER
ncbi:hypothetical protein GCM10008023_06210 [Sphingomonas glacialis]|uniref:Cytosine-specific methyltransferase n=1 Tax=Sphingomonas glacialis TaxID=658225 RepID=A0ABQ3LAA4_9SPHN|nr:DNA cytosine methyltransferase [Sphingomonas glacialis]GHH09477.1 hypothetical protein GCM10008023_06210 [Sphingomonas glacialis]